MGRGAKNIPANANRIPITDSFPNIFPNKRMLRDKTLEKCPITSIGIIRGESHSTGPTNCLRYFIPCCLTPIAWVKQKVQMARARVVFKFAVGEKKPGISPNKLDIRMKRNTVAIYGIKKRPLSPAIVITKFSSFNTINSTIFWRLDGITVRFLQTSTAPPINKPITSHVWVRC